MTQSAAQHRPFAFDTEFDASGGVISTAGPSRTTKRVYLAAEVEALLAQARLEAREQALTELESVRVMAVSEIAQALNRALPALARVAGAYRADAADLALAAANVIAASALERFPVEPVRAALEALGQEVDASPRLVVRSGGLDPEARAEIEAIAAEAGFSGQVSFRDDTTLEPAAFALEWADGRAEYSPVEAARRVGEALSAALAAEDGHAEAIGSASSAPDGHQTFQGDF